MTVERILICVLIMALVTYLTRMLPLAIFKKKITNRFIRSFLAYVPYAVLSAMTFPAILYSTAEPGSAATAANMIAAGLGLAVALLLAYKNKGLLTVALGSTAMVFLADLALHWIGI